MQFLFMSRAIDRGRSARRAGGAGLACLALIVVVAGCGGGGSSSSAGGSATGEATTAGEGAAPAAGNGQLGKVSWVPLAGEPRSLAIGNATAGYPELTIVPNLCDSLLRAKAGGGVEPGLAELVGSPNPTTYVLKMRNKAKFWDGRPVTAADAVYSLEQSISPTAANFFVLSDINSVEAKGADEIVVHLHAPDVAIPEYLGSAAGIVAEKKYAEEKGKAYGTPQGGIMCSGPFKISSWKRGQSLTIVPSGHYWDKAYEPHVKEVQFDFIEDPDTLSNSLVSGSVDGTFAAPAPSLSSLESNSGGTLQKGPSLQVASLSITAEKGPLADPQVREALDIAVNREGVVKTIYSGAAEATHSAILPPTWTYEKPVFEAANEALPGVKPEVEKAKELVQAAGAEGEKFVIATPAVSDAEPLAVYVQQVAQEIGLEAELKTYPSLVQFLSLFYEAKAREGIDAIVNNNFTVVAEPLGFLASMALPTGLNNYDGYENPKVTALLEKALGSESEKARAKYATEADAIFESEPNNIMLAMPTINLWQKEGITGAPADASYESLPWAALLRPGEG
jgi:peptide/nickel transport system substrate-binding protein